MADVELSNAVPFEARKAMQDALWNDCILSDNEWTTWTDSITLAETAAMAITRAGFKVVQGEPPTCESCGQPADTKLGDGSWWCNDCDEAARSLGYGPKPEEVR